MLTKNDILCCIVFGIATLVLLALSIVFMLGKGANLISGYNMMSEKEKKKYDSAAMCRFWGKYLLSIAILTPVIPFGEICGISWLPWTYAAYVMISAICVIVYCNTGNRFRK